MPSFAFVSKKSASILRQILSSPLKEKIELKKGMKVYKKFAYAALISTCFFAAAFLSHSYIQSFFPHSQHHPTFKRSKSLLSSSSGQMTIDYIVIPLEVAAAGCLSMDQKKNRKKINFAASCIILSSTWLNIETHKK